MLNMNVYNVLGFLIHNVSLIQSTVRHVPGYWQDFSAGSGWRVAGDG